jgi:hypothetical protein
MRPAASSVKLTYDDYLLFPDDGKRHELIDGEHYVTPCPFTKHQRLVGTIHWLIRSHLESHSVGEIFVAPFDIVFSNFDVVEPDLLYMSRARGGNPHSEERDRSAGTRDRDCLEMHEEAGRNDQAPPLNGSWFRALDCRSRDRRRRVSLWAASSDASLN